MAANDESCPSNCNLADFLFDQCGGDQAIGIAEHIDQCASCQKACDQILFEQESRFNLACSELDSNFASDWFQHAPDMPSTMRQADDTQQQLEDHALHDKGDMASAIELERFELLEEIAQGGMGVVYRAWDQRLSREVAVKVCRGGTDEDRDARFNNEARIAGQMQHPSIVPVYDSGKLPDGRQYLAMKFIKGQTLDKLCANTGNGQLGIPNRLRVFEQVCQAIGYAHTQNIVHRDLKPSNIMVGEFGEVQVMDWGLAKDLNDASGDSRNDNRSSTPRSAKGTSFGAVLGTPQYMAPEQAEGNLAQIDQRTDVFCLGGVLYTILTGHPPNSGNSAKSMLDQAVFADYGDLPTKIRSIQADKKLVGLLLDCMDKQPHRRPADGLAVAQRVNQYLAQSEERIQAARIETETAKTKIAEQKRRVRVVMISTGLIGLLAVGGLTAGWWAVTAKTQRDLRTANLETKIENGISQADFFLERVSTQDRSSLRLATLENARTAAIQAIELAGDEHISTDTRGECDRVLARIELRFEEESLASELESLLQGHRTFGMTPHNEPILKSEKDNAVISALARHHLDPRGDLAKFAERAKSLSDRTLSIVINSLDYLTFVDEHRQPVSKLLLSIDRDPWRTKLQQSIHDWDEVALRDLASRTDLSSLTPSQFILFAEWLRRFGIFDRYVHVLQEGVRQNPGHFTLNIMQGYRLLNVNPKESVKYLLVAHALQPKDAMVAELLAKVYHNLMDLDHAIIYARKATNLEPNRGWSYLELLRCLYSTGRSDEATKLIQDAVDQAKLSRVDGLELMAALAKWQGRFEDAVQIARQVLDLDPTRHESCFIAADCCLSLGRIDEQIEFYQRAAQVHSDNSVAWYYLGTALMRAQRYEEAIPVLKRAIQLNAVDARAHCNLAHCYKFLGRFRDAIAPIRKGHELGLLLDDWPYQSEIWLKHILAEAASESEIEDYLARDIDDLIMQQYIGLANNCQRRQMYREAIEFYDRCRQINPQGSRTRDILVRGLRRATGHLLNTSDNPSEIRRAMSALTAALEFLISQTKAEAAKNGPNSATVYEQMISPYRPIIHWVRSTEKISAFGGEFGERWQKIEQAFESGSGTRVNVEQSD